MSSGYSPLFFSEHLRDMNRGSVTLGVPLQEDIVQVGVIGEAECGQLIVSKGILGVISVQREDGRPFQAEIVKTNTDLVGEDNPGGVQKFPVLVEPVRELKFRRTRDTFGRTCWYADGENVAITDRSHVEDLAEIIGIYALRKQSKTLRT